MKYCRRKAGNVSDHRCNTSKHPECIQDGKRTGYCHYKAGYVPQCGHDYCTEKQGQNLMKLISGLYHLDDNGTLHKLKRGNRIPNILPRNGDGLRKELRTNRITLAGHVNRRRNWITHRSAAAYMRAGRGE